MVSANQPVQNRRTAGDGGELGSNVGNLGGRCGDADSWYKIYGVVTVEVID